jgi:hypothetical protein
VTFAYDDQDKLSQVDRPWLMDAIQTVQVTEEMGRDRRKADASRRSPSARHASGLTCH